MRKQKRCAALQGKGGHATPSLPVTPGSNPTQQLISTGLFSESARRVRTVVRVGVGHFDNYRRTSAKRLRDCQVALLGVSNVPKVTFYKLHSGAENGR